MEAMTVAEVVGAIEGELVVGDADVKISGVSTDSRKVRPKDLFFAIRGDKFDGHDFVNAAVKDGAAGVVVSKDLAIPPVTIRVGDTVVALGDLAGYYVSRTNVPVVAITGSVGKTTTKEMIAAVLSRRYVTLKNELNFNNEIGVPMTLFRLERHHQAAAIEMAMRLPGEIARLAEIAKPCVGVITNIGMSHIERLGSMENIAAAKAELLDSLPDHGLAVLPADDRFFDFLLGRCRCNVVSFGVTEIADARGTNVALDDQGRATLDVCMANSPPFRVRLPVTGEHNVRNALAAAAVGRHFHIPAEEIRSALEEFSPPEKRANLVTCSRRYRVLDDTYNASPASVASALSTLAKMRAERKIAVLGDMLELGLFAHEAHEQVGRQAARSGVELLIAVGEYAEVVAEAARESGLVSVETVETSEQAAELLKSIVKAGDLVLVKGSRAMRMEKVVDSLVS